MHAAGAGRRNARADHGTSALADTPVLDPARTVQTDVNRVLWAEENSQNVRVSGHVYDVGTGLVTTVVNARARK